MEKREGETKGGMMEGKGRWRGRGGKGYVEEELLLLVCAFPKARYKIKNIKCAQT